MFTKIKLRNVLAAAACVAASFSAAAAGLPQQSIAKVLDTTRLDGKLHITAYCTAFKPIAGGMKVVVASQAPWRVMSGGFSGGLSGWMNSMNDGRGAGSYGLTVQSSNSVFLQRYASYQVTFHVVAVDSTNGRRSMESVSLPGNLCQPLFAS
jgi:hypothetical protein